MNRHFVLAATALSCLAGSLTAAPAPTEKEAKLIELISSSAPKGERAVACKKLAIYGTDAAVPALAELLCDADLASWARIGLEPIPGPVADAAFRDEIPKVQGGLLVGVINSIGVRRDPKAVPALAAKLTDADTEVAAAAADALGRIGGKPAEKALKPLLASAPPYVRASVAEGCVRCAEQYLAAGKRSDAVALYDAVRKADVPRGKLLEATRGAILARETSGLDLLLAELRSPDKAHFGLALRVARELPGSAVDTALGAEVWKTPEDRQAYVLMALADRGPAAAVPVSVEAIKRGSPKMRLAAISTLERVGGARVVPALLEPAAGTDAEQSTAAVTALVRMTGADVDPILLTCLEPAQGKLCQVLIDVAAQRRIEAALPVISRHATDADEGVRSASLRALGTLGRDGELAALVQLLGQPGGARDRAGIEAALLTIAGREHAASVPRLQALATSGEGANRVTGLHALAAAGGPQALAAVKAGTGDADEAVRDEAVRTLSSWPNTWPEDAAVMAPLVDLARNAPKASHKVLALRGCLEFLQNDKHLKPNEKPAKVAELVPLMARPEEKRLAIAVVRNALTAEALDLLATFTADAGVADDAASAILDLTAKKGAGAIPKAARVKALQAVGGSSAGDAAKKSAADALRKLD